MNSSTLFSFSKNLVYKNIQAQMTENIRISQKQNMSSDSTHREKPFKHIFGGRGSGKSPKTGLNLRISQAQRKLRYSYKKKCV